MRASYTRTVAVSALPLALAVLLAGCGARQAGAAAPTSVPRTATTSTSSTTSAPRPVLVVGLGDSVTAGTACACSPFVARYAALLGARDGVAARAANLGVPGLTTSTMAAQLAEPAVRHQVSRADIIVVTIGANDLGGLIPRWSATGCPQACSRPVVAAMGRGLATDLDLIRSAGRPGQQVLVTNYWNVFEDGDVADRLRGTGFADWSNQVTLEANDAICAAAQTAGDRCVDLYMPFEGADGRRNPTSMLAADGDHPNSAGHLAIARALLAATPLLG